MAFVTLSSDYAMKGPKPQDSTALKRWRRLRNAYNYAREHIASKAGGALYKLDIIDFVLVSNFKGGNASIAEPTTSAAHKLSVYSRHLQTIECSFRGKSLKDLNETSLKALCNAASGFLGVALSQATRIDGFGPSYASAMLNIYFPDLLPILDRRVLLAAGAPGVKVNSQGQVRNIEQHYSWLIKYSYRRLKKDRKLTMSQLDCELFSTKLASWARRKPAKQR